MFDMSEFTERLSGGYDFGLAKPEKIAAALHRLADLVQTGHIIMQGVDSASKATSDDWLKRELILTYIEKDGPQLKEIEG